MAPYVAEAQSIDLNTEWNCLFKLIIYKHLEKSCISIFSLWYLQNMMALGACLPFSRRRSTYHIRLVATSALPSIIAR